MLIHENLAELPHLQFHAVTLFQVLEHLDDPLDVLRDLHGRLAPGGILILETPDCSGVTDIIDRDTYAKIHPLEHINGFTPITMRRFAERLGFESIKRPPAYITTDVGKVARTFVGHLIKAVTTEQYFRKPKTSA